MRNSEIRKAIRTAYGTESGEKFAAKVRSYFSKPHSELHEFLANGYAEAAPEFLALFAGETDAEKLANACKAEQVIVSGHPDAQKIVGPLRETYRARTVASIAKGGRTTYEKRADALSDAPVSAPAPTGKRTRKAPAAAK